MEIVVLGNHGMLGRYVHAYAERLGYSVCGVNRAMGFDARKFDQSQFVHKISQIKEPFAVINCIGAIKQKHADADTLFAVNGMFPQKLAAAISNIDKARLIHISSDCVFSGHNCRHGYMPDSKRDAEDFYGQSKIIGEECSWHHNCKVIRTSIVGEDPRSKLSLLEWVRANAGGNINGYVDHLWNGVTCLHLAQACLNLAKNFDEFFGTKILHLPSPHPVTKYSLVQMIADCYQLNVTVNAVKTDQPINRTLRCWSEYGNASDLSKTFSDFYKPLAAQLQDQRQFFRQSE